MTNALRTLTRHLICVGIVCLSIETAYSQYSFTTFQDPAGGTYANGISGNEIVGQLIPFGHPSDVHGFLYDGNSYTTFDVPFANSGTTRIDGISGNQIVGFYVDNVDASTKGFIYNSSGYTSLAVSGSRVTEAAGVSGSNVVGGYQTITGPDNQVKFNGFLYNGGSYTTLNDPLGINGTFANGINSSGAIVGFFQDSTAEHGFLYSADTWITLDYPLGVEGTFATGINDNGRIVGYYYDNSSHVHGFLYTGSSYITLDVPGASNTWAQGISSDGRIVGYYDGSNGPGSFIASVPEPTSTILVAVGALMLIASANCNRSVFKSVATSGALIWSLVRQTR